MTYTGVLVDLAAREWTRVRTVSFRARHVTRLQRDARYDDEGIPKTRGKSWFRLPPILRLLLDSLVTTAAPRDRETEAERARARAAERFGRP